MREPDQMAGGAFKLERGDSLASFVLAWLHASGLLERPPGQNSVGTARKRIETGQAIGEGIGTARPMAVEAAAEDPPTHFGMRHRVAIERENQAEPAWEAREQRPK